MPHNYFTLFFRYLLLAILSIILVQGIKYPSNMSISKLLSLNSNIKVKLMSKSKNQPHMNYSALDPVLFEKLYNIKLSQSVVRVSTFFQFEATKAPLEDLIHYVHNCDENMKTLYSTLVTSNDFDHK